MEQQLGFSYPLSFEHQHLFVQLPEGKFLVDTGAPISFGRTSVTTYNGITTPLLPKLGHINVDSLQALIPTSVGYVGLLGTDRLLSEPLLFGGPTSTLTVDKSLLSSFPKDAVLFESALGIIFRAKIGGSESVKVLLDTGAKFGYVIDRKLLHAAREDGEFQDWNPIIGKIESKAWKIDVEFCGIEIEERVGYLENNVLSQALKQIDVALIVGCSWMEKYQVWIDPLNNLLAVE